ncbi:MAG: peroxidase family protein [Actinophytocola sp.]|uniref:peroxidase family protein n=1 Tax=Actinophytocola sp. TaxID=1872138 RepID=UPI003D6AAC33
MPASNPEVENHSTTLDRRRFLGGVGVGVAGAASSLFLKDVEARAEQVEGPTVTAAPDPRFSRMFQLPAFADPRSSAVRAAMSDIGKLGGLMDARDPLNEGPVRLITMPELSPRNIDQNIANMTAGTTFVGQFLDHDITFDNSSPLGTPAEPTATPNVRDARLDLDSVYGGGPSVTPEIYNSSDRAKFLVSSGGRFEDLPRYASNLSAAIVDPRNDEHLIIAGLHAAFLLAHNRTVDHRRANNLPGDVWFYSRRTMIHHWQWIVVNEFLPQIVGRPLVDDILRNGRRWYRFSRPAMPVEFQTGSYRFGHSLVRPSYRANRDGDPGGNPDTGAPAFFGFIFDPAGEGQSDPVDLRGGARARRRFIGWETFFNFGGAFTQHVRPNKLIDTNISSPLFRLPLGAIPSRDAPISLAQRNLLRHLTWSLPSGQRIAAATGSPVLSSANFQELRTYNLGLDASTPLWYYVLREAQVVNNGVRLGPVGGRIVAETIIGLLQLDEFSYLNSGFRPTLPSQTSGTFRMTDLLRWARVDPISRGTAP